MDDQEHVQGKLPPSQPDKRWNSDVDTFILPAWRSLTPPPVPPHQTEPIHVIRVLRAIKQLKQYNILRALVSYFRSMRK